MQTLKNEHKIIVEYILDKHLQTKSKMQKNIYEADLIEYIKKFNLTEIDDVLILLNKNIEKVYLYIVEYNYKNKVKDFEEMIMEIFKKEDYQAYEFENTSLKENIRNDVEQIKSLNPNYKITDDLISKLINTLKARVRVNENDADYNLPWAPEALIAVELLNIFMNERLELYYLSPSKIDVSFNSIVKSEIIEQRINKKWIEEDKDFIKSNKIENFNIKERNILSDLIDFLPELKTIKLGISLNYPERYLEERLKLILVYFEKSEVDFNRKENVLHIINVFFNEYIFKFNIKSKHYDNCKEIMNQIKLNIEKTKNEENILSVRPKNTKIIDNKNNNETIKKLEPVSNNSTKSKKKRTKKK